MSPSCAPSCAISAPATATWRRATCAPTSTSPCASPASPSARAARSRTSTRSASSARRSRYEARRQIGILEDGGTIDQETRLYDPGKGETRSMRSKEEAHDYRYFPDPDLLPLEFDEAYVDELKRASAGAARRQEGPLHRGLRPLALRRLGARRWRSEQADYFEAVAKGRDGKAAANWVINELFGRLNKEGQDVTTSPVSADQLGGIVDLIQAGHFGQASPRTCSRSSGPRGATRAPSSRPAA
jgi:Asp-tRNA(Asn)/Glu-tRNA(Gln) amidotransferase B subunit